MSGCWSRSVAAFEIAALAALAMACGHSKTPAPETPAERAWREIGELHREAVEERLAALSEQERADVEAFFAGREEDPRELAVALTPAGTPATIGSHGFRVDAEALGLGKDAAPAELARAFVEKLGPLWSVPASAFAQAEVTELPGPDGQRVAAIRFSQRIAGLPVVAGAIDVRIDPERLAVVGAAGAFAPIRENFALPKPRLSAAEAGGRVRLAAGERLGPVTAVVSGGHLGGGAREPRPAWRAEVLDAGGGHLRTVWIDALDGAELGQLPRTMAALQRATWDLHGRWQAYSCNNWNDFTPATGCPACAGRPKEMCACRNDAREAACEAEIWRYDEDSSCRADGDPAGEADCSADAQALRRDSERMWTYWNATFGRDSWDGSGGYLLGKASADPASPWGGLAVPWNPDGDAVFDGAWITIRATAANPQLHGHELGHLLEFGTALFDGPSFHHQSSWVLEHLADVQGFRYRGERLGRGYDCAGAFSHYRRYGSADSGQANKFIGNCHGWLMSNSGSASHGGVTVRGVGAPEHDQIWYRALSAPFRTSATYFDWWNTVIDAAFDLRGWGPSYYAAVLARDAVGGWTNWSSVASAVPAGDRFAAASWPGAPRGPCVFSRYPGDPDGIYWQCYTPGGWTRRALLNDDAVDPAASEPAAAVRVEADGNRRIYVVYCGADDRLWYRTLDPVDFSIGGPWNLGEAVRAGAEPAAAAVRSGAGADRLVVVYHPLPRPTWFFATELSGPAGSPATAPLDLGPSFDSDVPPSLVSYPERERVYLVRADPAAGAAPRQLRYASYTPAAGWSGLTDLTRLYEVPDEPGRPTFMPSGVVRTDRGVALAVYGLSMPRLRMTFLTLDGELWLAVLRESAPGVLVRDDYRAVPLAPPVAGTQSAGGLAAGVSGTVLWHFWARGHPLPPKLYNRRYYGD